MALPIKLTQHVFTKLMYLINTERATRPNSAKFRVHFVSGLAIERRLIGSGKSALRHGMRVPHWTALRVSPDHGARRHGTVLQWNQDAREEIVHEPAC